MKVDEEKFLVERLVTLIKRRNQVTSEIDQLRKERNKQIKESERLCGEMNLLNASYKDLEQKITEVELAISGD